MVGNSERAAVEWREQRGNEKHNETKYTPITIIPKAYGKAQTKHPEISNYNTIKPSSNSTIIKRLK